MDKSEFDARARQWQNRLNQEFSQAPGALQQAFAKLSAGDNEAAEKMLSQCALAGAWTGTASCIIAYLHAQRKEYQQAIMFAEAGKKFGLVAHHS